MLEKLTDEQCQEIWDNASKENPLKLDERGIQVMDYLARKNNDGVTRRKPLGHVETYK